MRARQVAGSRIDPKLEAYLPHPLFKDIWPKERRLKATRLVAPLYHGDHLEGLSGLYTILNALRLALAVSRPLTDAEVDRLHQAAVAFIEARQSLANCMRGGIRLELWHRLAEALTYQAARVTGQTLRLERPFRHEPRMTGDQALSVIEAFIEARRCVMMLRSGGRYSVVCGFTPISLILFDSFGHSWIRRDGCGISGAGAHMRHAISPSSIITLTTPR